MHVFQCLGMYINRIGLLLRIYINVSLIGHECKQRFRSERVGGYMLDSCVLYVCVCVCVCAKSTSGVKMLNKRRSQVGSLSGHQKST